MMQGGHQVVEVLQGPQPGIDLPVVIDVVATVSQCRRIERTYPHGINSQYLKVGGPGGDAGQVAQAIAIGISKTSGVDLVNDGLAPPIRVGIKAGLTEFRGRGDGGLSSDSKGTGLNSGSGSVNYALPAVKGRADAGFRRCFPCIPSFPQGSGEYR